VGRCYGERLVGRCYGERIERTVALFGIWIAGKTQRSVAEFETTLVVVKILRDLFVLFWLNRVMTAVDSLPLMTAVDSLPLMTAVDSLRGEQNLVRKKPLSTAMSWKCFGKGKVNSSDADYQKFDLYFVCLP